MSETNEPAPRSMAQLVDELGDVVGLQCFLIVKGGDTIEYSRVIDAEFFATMTKDSLQFYGDDTMYALQRKYNESTDEVK